MYVLCISIKLVFIITSHLFIIILWSFTGEIIRVGLFVYLGFTLEKKILYFVHKHTHTRTRTHAHIHTGKNLQTDSCYFPTEFRNCRTTVVWWVVFCALSMGILLATDGISPKTTIPTKSIGSSRSACKTTTPTPKMAPWARIICVQSSSNPHPGTLG